MPFGHLYRAQAIKYDKESSDRKKLLYVAQFGMVKDHQCEFSPE